MTMLVDNWDPNTYLWILQECDVPYVPEEWKKLLAKFGREKMTSTTIIGRYLSKMKLKQFKDYRWKDNEFLQQLAEAQIKEAMEGQGFDIQDITLAIQKRQSEMPDEVAPPPQNIGGYYDVPNPAEINSEAEEPFQREEDYFANQIEVPDIALDLTDEDKIYLCLKWGKAYRPEEWVKLEQLYEEMMSSYDIQGAGHIDTLKMVCKTSLKANQLLDIGDIEGAQKVVKMYDALMKSGKFTAAQNKAEQGEFIDSIGELVALCETQGYIERYYTETPQDKVDITLKDMQRYTAELVENETNLSALVEQAIKQNLKEDENDKEDTDEIVLDDLDLEEIEKDIKDEDFENFGEFLEEERAKEKEILGLLEEDE